MRIEGSSQEAYVALLEQANAARLLSPIEYQYIRSLEDSVEPFISKDRTTWFSRFFERVIYYVTYPFSSRKIRPYDFEANLDYLQALVQKIGEHQSRVVPISKELYQTVFNRFSLNVGDALSHLIGKVDRIYESATFTDNDRSAALRATIDAVHNQVTEMKVFPKIVFSSAGTEEEALRASVEFFEAEMRQEIEKIGRITDETDFIHSMEALERRLNRSVEDPALIFKLRSFCITTRLGRSLQRMVLGSGQGSAQFVQDESMNDDLKTFSSAFYDKPLQQILEDITVLRAWDKEDQFETGIRALEEEVKGQLLFAVTGVIETLRKQFIAQVSRDHEEAAEPEAKRGVLETASFYLEKCEFVTQHPLFGVIDGNMQIMRNAVAALQAAPSSEDDNAQA